VFHFLADCEGLARYIPLSPSIRGTGAPQPHYPPAHCLCGRLFGLVEALCLWRPPTECRKFICISKSLFDELYVFLLLVFASRLLFFPVPSTPTCSPLDFHLSSPLPSAPLLTFYFPAFLGVMRFPKMFKVTKEKYSLYYTSFVLETHFMPLHFSL